MDLTLGWLALYRSYPAMDESVAARCNETCRQRLAARYQCDLAPGVDKPVPCKLSESSAFWGRLESDYSKRVVACDGPHGQIECVEGALNYCVIEELYVPNGTTECRKGVVDRLRTSRDRKQFQRIAGQCAWTVYCQPRSRKHLNALGLGSRHPAWPIIAVNARDTPPRAERVADDDLVYLARRGDCGGPEPNPAHCMGDPVNFYAVTRLISVSGRRTRVFLGAGYNYGAGGSWGNATARNLDNSVLWSVWRAGAHKIDAFRDLASYDVDKVRRAATSPSPMSAITWGPNFCKAEVLSPVLADFRRRVDPFISTLDGVPEEGPQATGYVLVVTRNSKRAIHNLDDLLAQARLRFADHRIHAHVFNATTPYPLQIALWRRARLVVGLHGGGLAGAVWLAPGQALLEITPREKACPYPSMFAHVAVAVGANYRAVHCEPCTMRNGGAVDIPVVIDAMATLLATASDT